MDVGDGFLVGETIASVDAVDGVSDVVEVDGDELGLGKRTPSKEIPLTSSFTTSCGSPVEEFSDMKTKVRKKSFGHREAQLTFADDFELHSV
jgi:hypothetical protein